MLCRITGVPLMDGGTIRLPRLIGLSKAMDLVLTGRLVDSDEAMEIGLAQYIADAGTTAVEKAVDIAKLIASHPQECMRIDRRNILLNWEEERRLLSREFKDGYNYIRANGHQPSVARFVQKSKL